MHEGHRQPILIEACHVRLGIAISNRAAQRCDEAGDGDILNGDRLVGGEAAAEFDLKGFLSPRAPCRVLDLTKQ
jgi:hypothetical protein